MLPGRFVVDQWIVLLFFFLVALVGAVMLRLLVPPPKSRKRRIIAGACLGFGLPAIGAYVGMKIQGGFESPAVFLGGLVMGVPSSIGGALAGWIQSRKVAVSV
jgi:hypothetical protein